MLNNISNSKHKLLSILNQYEPSAMRCQPDIIWKSADNYWVTDINDKRYIDFTSGVMITNAGHGTPLIKKALMEWLETGINTSYLFPNAAKASFLQELAYFIPENYQTALYSTGAEAIEAAIKIAFYWAKLKRNITSPKIISFENAFHGRTLGAQLIGGIASLKQHIPATLHRQLSWQIPFPETHTTFQQSLDCLKKKLNVSFAHEITNVVAVMIECYQGGVGQFILLPYFQSLTKWCKEHDILLIVDEVQSGCGRTGKFWAYDHYQAEPDLFVTGKGLSSSLPLSAIVGKKTVFEGIEAGTLNTTHSGNPLCCIAGAANLRFLREQKLTENAQHQGELLHQQLAALALAYPRTVRAIYGKGLMACLHIGDQHGNKPSPTLAKTLVNYCIENGLLLCNPGGLNGATLKVCPPLTIDKKGVLSGISLLEQSLKQLEHEKQKNVANL